MRGDVVLEMSHVCGNKVVAVLEGAAGDGELDVVVGEEVHVDGFAKLERGSRDFMWCVIW